MAWDCKDWKAWCDHMPGPSQPRLHIVGTCTFPTPGYTAEFRESDPQGPAYPQTLDVFLVVTEPASTQPEVLTDVEARLDREGGPEHEVVNITDFGLSINVDHIETS